MDKLSIYGSLSVDLKFFAHIFPKMACFCQLFWPPKLVTPTGQFFYTDISVISVTFSNSGQSQDQVVNRTAEYHSSAKIVFCTFLFHFFLFTNLINKVEIRHNFCTFFALSHLLVPQLSEKLVEIKFASNLKVGRV